MPCRGGSGGAGRPAGGADAARALAGVAGAMVGLPRLTTDQQARFLVVVLTMEKRYDLLVTMGLGAPGGSEESKPLT